MLAEFLLGNLKEINMFEDLDVVGRYNGIKIYFEKKNTAKGMD